MNEITTYALPVMEAFYTIQGEGFHQGKAAYFIRLGGCDVGCFWCDVKESWDMSQFKLVAIEDIICEIKRHPAEIVVITGGEPLIHDLASFTRELKKEGFKIHLETSGSSPLSGSFDWICLSPKKFKPPLPEILLKADELKVIVYNKSDFNWAEQFASEVSETCKLFLQPEWEQSSKVTSSIVEYIKCNPKWEISLQMHKYIGVP